MPNQALLEEVFAEHMAALHDRLAPYQGGKAHIASYSLGHSELRIEVSNDEGSCVVFCEACSVIQGPFWWKDCAITIHPQFYGENYIRFVVCDTDAGFELRCGRAAVVFPDQPSFRSHETEALAVVHPLLPMWISEMRNPIATIRSAVQLLQRQKPSFPESSQEEDWTYFLDRMLQQTARLNTMVNELGVYVRYGPDAVERMRAAEQIQPTPVETPSELAFLPQWLKQEHPSASNVAGHIASIIGHELNNPLASASGYLQLLQRMEGSPKDERDEALATVLRSIKHAQVVTKEIVAYCQTISRFENNENMNTEVSHEQSPEYKVALFYAMYCSEIITPLTAVHGYLQVLQRIDRLSQEDRDEFIANALSLTDRTMWLVRQVQQECRTIMQPGHNDSAQ